MSTTNNLRYMAPPVPVWKCQPRKIANKRYRSAAYDIKQILLIFVTAIVHFYDAAALLWIHTD